MALLKSVRGTISGIGNSESRLNEITGDELAVFRNFVIGYHDGVLKYNSHDFDYSANGNTVHITDGMCFAYGYFAYCHAKDFIILPPAVESYYIIYARIDKSVIPNTAELKLKNNYASPNIGVNAFRQDQLSTVKTGVYEMPLCLFKITNKGIDKTSFVDLRKLREKIEKVEYADAAYTVLSHGYLESGVTAVTKDITDNSKKIATTAFVKAAVLAEINK